MTLAAWLASGTLVHLSPVDLIIVFYFALVVAIDLYSKEQANPGEDFFMTGREMTAWVAGLAFLSANLGSLELMGWAGNGFWGLFAGTLSLIGMYTWAKVDPGAVRYLALSSRAQIRRRTCFVLCGAG
jgi:solute:Na+ symporter, SSS family